MKCDSCGYVGTPPLETFDVCPDCGVVTEKGLTAGVRGVKNCPKCSCYLDEALSTCEWCDHPGRAGKPEARPTAPKPRTPQASKLIPCPICGKEVYRLASACPHCGAPVRDMSTPRSGAALPSKSEDGLIAFGVITALLVPLIGFIIGVVLLAKGRAGAGIGIMLLSMAAGFAWMAMLFNWP